jgi:hypothetical protein
VGTQYNPHPVSFCITNVSAMTHELQVILEIPPVSSSKPAAQPGSEGAEEIAVPQFAGEKSTIVRLLPGAQFLAKAHIVPTLVGISEVLRCRCVVRQGIEGLTNNEFTSQHVRMFVLPEGAPQMQGTEESQYIDLILAT